MNFASDKLLALAVSDKEWQMQLSTFKGFAFVIVTTLLLYLLLQTRSTQLPASDMHDALKANTPSGRCNTGEFKIYSAASEMYSMFSVFYAAYY